MIPIEIERTDSQEQRHTRDLRIQFQAAHSTCLEPQSQTKAIIQSEHHHKHQDQPQDSRLKQQDNRTSDSQHLTERRDYDSRVSERCATGEPPEAKIQMLLNETQRTLVEDDELEEFVALTGDECNPTLRVDGRHHLDTQTHDDINTDNLSIEVDDDDFDYLRLDTIVEEDEEGGDANINPIETSTNTNDRSSNVKQRDQNCDSHYNNKQTNEQLDARLASPTNATPADNKTSKLIGRQVNSNDEHEHNNNLNTKDETQTRSNQMDDRITDSYNRSLRKFSLERSNQMSCGPSNQTNEQHATGAMRKSSSQVANEVNHQLLPSTKRLISEHQARNQQQALFRALAERQKLMDELDVGDRREDLMSGVTLRQLDAMSSTSSTRSRPKRRHQTESGQPNQDHRTTSGVSLSLVDYSSMSDRMLDDLLGHIAPASSSSSSSLSSNGESLNSSDLSADDSDTDDTNANYKKNYLEDQTSRPNQRSLNQTNAASRRDCDLSTSSSGSGGEATTSRRSRTRRGQVQSNSNSGSQLSSSNSNSISATLLVDAPNIVGVHEDATCMARAAQRRIPINCRDAHRKASSACDSEDHEDDDDDNDHELIVHLNGPAGASTSDSLSPNSSTATASNSRDATERHHQELAEASANHELDTLAEVDDEKSLRSICEQESESSLSRSPKGQSVEKVLWRMLDALNEATSERESSSGPRVNSEQEPDLETRSLVKKQEKLNELLENGFSKLEQLLNCSLAPTNLPPNEQQVNFSSQIRSHQPNLVQKLISNQQLQQQQQQQQQPQTLSKDSDYGSDTQSADCISHLLIDQNNLSSEGQTGPRTATNRSQTLEPKSLVGNQQQVDVSDRPATKIGDQSAGVLSPVAIELSNRLFESIKRLAQQQQQQQPSEPRQVQASQASPVDKTPMKSVVLINATRSPSAASIISSLSSSSSPMVGASGESQTASNMTPESGKQTPANQRQQFKTCVNINGSANHNRNSNSNQVSQVLLAGRGECSSPMVAVRTNSSSSTPAPAPPSTSTSSTTETTATSTPQDVDLQRQSAVKVKSKSVKSWPKEREEQQQHQQQDHQVQQTTDEEPKESAASDASQVPLASSCHPPLERRRSSRSSLRRRPSFTGSINGAHHPRPGSPVPRSLLQVEGEATCKSGSTLAMSNRQLAEPLPDLKASGEAEEELRQRSYKRVQRAIVYGQKYNYSPTKFAYSKLGAHLQLNGESRDSSPKQKWTQLEYPGKTTVASGNQRDLKGEWTSKLLDISYSGLQLVAAIANVVYFAPSPGLQTIERKAGKVELEISYFAKSGSLTVDLIQCAQLPPATKRRDSANPYVKLYLLPDRSKSGKRKSSVKRSELNPKFNERFTFGPIQLANFEGRCLWLSVWHKDRLGRNEPLGELALPLTHVRQQLLNSDLCQSTSARWYQLTTRVASSEQDNIGATYRRAKQQTGEFKAAQPSDKLGELQMKAARLTTAVAPPRGPSVDYQSATMNVRCAPVTDLGYSSRALISGQLFVALRFLPEGRQLASANRLQNSEGELQVLIKEANNIAGFESPIVDSSSSLTSTHQSPKDSKEHLNSAPVGPAGGSLPNTFGKCYLLSSSGQRLMKHKTPIVKKSANPQWDYKCVFNSLKLSQLASQAIEIQLFNRDSILVSHINEYLGGVRLCRSRDTKLIDMNSSSPGASSKANSNDLAKAKPIGGNMSATLLRTKSQTYEDTNSNVLCTERESRLWEQMLAKPAIWVYGDLRLRRLQPLVAESPPASTQAQLSTSTNQQTNQATQSQAFNSSFAPVNS